MATNNAINSSPITWNLVSSSITMIINTGYIVNTSGSVILTLPSVAPRGSVFRIINNSGGSIIIAQNAGNIIRLGSTTTTSGTSGSLVSTGYGDNLEIVCTIANSTFVVCGPVGNFTLN